MSSKITKKDLDPVLVEEILTGGKQGPPGPQGEPGSPGPEGPEGKPGTSADVPMASLDTAGKVKLSNSTTSDSETEAATSKAVKDAMNRAEEAFRGADNGKVAFQSIVGAPSTIQQKWSEIGTHGNNAKSYLATNLTNKGVSATYTESLKSLADKVALISNSGKRSAKGVTIIAGQPFIQYTYAYLQVRGLSFRPSFIMVITGREDSPFGSEYEAMNGYSRGRILGFAGFPSNASGDITYYNDGFEVKFIVSSPYNYSVDAYWVAME